MRNDGSFFNHDVSYIAAASNLHRHSSAGHIRSTPRPYSDDFETTATQRPNTDTKVKQVRHYHTKMFE